MTTPCERLREAGPAALLPEELAAHLEGCPGCRDQVEIDALLRRCLGTLGEGSVPPGLEARTMWRLRQAEPTLGRRERLLLGAYWALALLLSAVVVLLFDRPTVGAMAATTLLAVTAAALLPAVPLLSQGLRRVRAGP